MRFAILAAPTLLASTAMSAVLVKIPKDKIPKDPKGPEAAWLDMCTLVLGDPNGCNLNPRGLQYGELDTVSSPDVFRGWCECPKGFVGYARVVSNRLGWTYKEGEAEPTEKDKKNQNIPNSIVVNFQASKKVYDGSSSLKQRHSSLGNYVLGLWGDACGKGGDATFIFQQQPAYTALALCPGPNGMDRTKETFDKLHLSDGWAQVP